MPSAADALGRVAAFGPHAAVVFGSGLAGLPPAAVVRAELGYEELGWPCTAVRGHRNVLQLVEVTAGSAGRDLDELQDVAMPAHGGAGPTELLVAELGPHHSRRRQAGEPRTEHDGRVWAEGGHAAERVRGGRHQPIARPGSGGVSPVRRAKACLLYTSDAADDLLC